MTVVDLARLTPSPMAEMKLSHVELGRRRHRCLVVDNYYRDPDYVAGLAHSLHFAAPHQRHSHARAEISLPTAALAEFVFKHAARDWCVPSTRVFDQASTGRWAFHRSVANTELGPLIRRAAPHVDEASVLSGVIHLTAAEYVKGGTGFFTHRPSACDEAFFASRPHDPASFPTDFSARIDLERLFAPWLEQGLEATTYHDFWAERLAVNPNADELLGSNETWELTELIEMRYNRMVIFPSFLLHKPMYDPDDFGGSPTTRRLTQNFWVPLRDKLS